MDQIHPTEDRIPKIVTAVRLLIRGRSNGARGQLTITQSQGTTTVSHDNITANARVVITPSSSAAAAEVASVYVSSVAAGSFVVTHPNNATAGRTFHWIASGG